ncbi:MAG: T9SS type A sorting domain-containing protein, partial [Bacteroidetes bacterium]|nr:T9SS type A sorting domain-containing protein [Bacteroidota bacterium]
FSGINKIASRVVLFDFVLKNNHPNPFNPSTQITYSLAQDADVTLKVYDMLGTEVAKLVNETQTVGNHEINFNAENLSSGVYIYRITASNNRRILFTDSKQMILLR